MRQISSLAEKTLSFSRILLRRVENVSDEEDMNRAWENIQENINTSAKDSLDLHELKQHKPWFDDEC